MIDTISLQEYSGLLAALYGAATSHEQTGKQFLSQLKQLTNLQHATLIVRPPSTHDAGLIYTSGDENDVPMLSNEAGSYSNLYAQDPLYNLPLNKFVRVEDISSAQQFLGSDYYKIFLKPFDIHYIAGIDWLYDRDSRISIRFTRDQSQGPFTAKEAEFFELLIPHFEQSVAIGIQLRQLDSERQIYADSIAKRSIGIITLNKQGNILQSNAAAARFLQNTDGIKESQHKIKLSNSAENDSLHEFINAAIEKILAKERPQINALAVSRESGKAAYQVMVKPMPVDFHDESDVTPYVSILIQDPEKNLEISIRSLMNLYHLTMSEATIAILLAEGHTTDEVATELTIKKNTVRAHLRSMFVKMGVTQQSMLVSLVLTSLASTQ